MDERTLCASAPALIGIARIVGFVPAEEHQRYADLQAGNSLLRPEISLMIRSGSLRRTHPLANEKEKLRVFDETITTGNLPAAGAVPSSPCAGGYS
jgi:hypothetical protein